MCRLLCPPCRQMGTAGHSHLHATDSAKLLVFSSSAENGRVVLSGPPALGAGGPRFKSGRPDHSLSYFQSAATGVVALRDKLRSNYKPLDAFNRLTLLSWNRIQINFARDARY